MNTIVIPKKVKKMSKKMAAGYKAAANAKAEGVIKKKEKRKQDKQERKSDAVEVVHFHDADIITKDAAPKSGPFAKVNQQPLNVSQDWLGRVLAGFKYADGKERLSLAPHGKHVKVTHPCLGAMRDMVAAATLPTLSRAIKRGVSMSDGKPVSLWVLCPDLKPYAFYMGLYSILFPTKPHEQYKETYRKLQVNGLAIKFYSPFSKTKFAPPKKNSSKLRPELSWVNVKNFDEVRPLPQDVVLDCGLVSLVGVGFLDVNDFFSLSVTTSLKEGFEELKNSSGYVEASVAVRDHTTTFTYDDFAVWASSKSMAQAASEAGWTAHRIFAGRVFTTAGAVRKALWHEAFCHVKKSSNVERGHSITPFARYYEGGKVYDAASLLPKDDSSFGNLDAESAWVQSGIDSVAKAAASGGVKAEPLPVKMQLVKEPRKMKMATLPEAAEDEVEPSDEPQPPKVREKKDRSPFKEEAHDSSDEEDRDEEEGAGVGVEDFDAGDLREATANSLSLEATQFRDKLKTTNAWFPEATVTSRKTETTKSDGPVPGAPISSSAKRRASKLKNKEAAAKKLGEKVPIISAPDPKNKAAAAIDLSEDREFVLPLVSIPNSWYSGLASMVSVLYSNATKAWSSGYESAALSRYKGLKTSDALVLYLRTNKEKPSGLTSAAVSYFWVGTPREDLSKDPKQIKELWSVICRSLISWPVSQEKYSATLTLVSKGQLVDYTDLAKFVSRRWGNLADLADNTHAVAGEDFHPVRTCTERAAVRFQRNYGVATQVAGLSLLLAGCWRFRFVVGPVVYKAMTASKMVAIGAVLGAEVSVADLAATAEAAYCADCVQIPNPWTLAVQLACSLTGIVAVTWVRAMLEEVFKVGITAISNEHIAAGTVGAMDVASRMAEGFTYNGPLAVFAHLYCQYSLHLYFIRSSDTIIGRSNRHCFYNILVAPFIGYAIMQTGEITNPGANRELIVLPKYEPYLDKLKTFGVNRAESNLPELFWNACKYFARYLQDLLPTTGVASASAACIAVSWYINLSLPASPATPEGQSKAVHLPKDRVASNDFEHRAASLQKDGMVSQGKREWVTPMAYMDNPGTGVWVSSICTRNCDVSQIAPGNKVETTGEYPLCTADRSRGYQCLFPIVNRLSVYSFASCYCNLINCFSNRMAGVPARYKEAFEKSENHYYAERAKVRVEWKRAIVDVDAINRNYVGLVERKPVVKLPVNEWLERYPAKMGETILNTWLTRDKPRIDMKAMVKFEKNVTRDPNHEKVDFDGIYARDDKKHVRGISIPAFEARAEVGPSCHFGSKKWGEVRSGRILYAVGTAEWQRANWFEAACEADGETYAAYAGDNILFVIGPKNDRRALCVDLKRMDMHVDPQAGGKCSTDWLNHIGEVKAGEFFDSTVNPRYKVYIGAATLKAFILGTQPSGAGNTTLNNSMAVDVIIHEVMNLDLDQSDGMLETIIRDCFSRFGFLITYDCVHINTRPLDVEFLQQRFYLALDCGVPRRAPGNRVGRILGRTFWTNKPLNLKKKRGFLRGVALGLEKANRHVPIINDLFRRILELTDGEIPYYDEEAIKKRRWKDEDDFKPIAFDEHPACEAELAEHVGRPITEIQELRQHIRQMPLFGFLNTASTAPLVEAFLDWDL